MAAFPSFRILGGRVDDAPLSAALAFILSELRRGAFLQVVTANALMALEAETDGELREIFEAAGLCVADSVGMVLAARWKGFPVAERVPGIDLLLALCETAETESFSVYLLGGKPGVAEEAGRRLRLRFPKLVLAGTAPGYWAAGEEDALLSDLKAKKPRFIFVALSSPRQEKWIHKNLRSLPGCCAMGVGGSLDVISGRLARAPLWLQKAGMEWLYRLIQEPWRWKRMLGLPLFFWKVFLQEKRAPAAARPH